MPFTLLAPVDIVQDIKKSRFIGQAAPISGEEEAKAFLAKVSDPAANHNCWAWRIGQPIVFRTMANPQARPESPSCRRSTVRILMVSWWWSPASSAASC